MLLSKFTCAFSIPPNSKFTLENNKFLLLFLLNNNINIITIKLTDGEFRICPVKNAKKSINISEVCSIHLSYEFSFCLLSILNKIYIVIIKNIKNPTIP